MTDDQWILKLQRLPKNLRQEIIDFADFLFDRYHKKKTGGLKPVFGSAKGKYVLKDDFDEPLEDFKEYM